jgi:hypothetical protein
LPKRKKRRPLPGLRRRTGGLNYSWHYYTTVTHGYTIDPRKLL